MVDAHVSGACGAIREGSSPSFDRFIIAFQPNTSGLEQIGKFASCEQARKSLLRQIYYCFST